MSEENEASVKYKAPVPLTEVDSAQERGNASEIQMTGHESDFYSLAVHEPQGWAKVSCDWQPTKVLLHVVIVSTILSSCAIGMVYIIRYSEPFVTRTTAMFGVTTMASTCNCIFWTWVHHHFYLERGRDMEGRLYWSWCITGIGVPSLCAFLCLLCTWYRIDWSWWGQSACLLVALALVIPDMHFVFETYYRADEMQAEALRNSYTALRRTSSRAQVSWLTRATVDMAKVFVCFGVAVGFIACVEVGRNHVLSCVLYKYDGIPLRTYLPYVLMICCIAAQLIMDYILTQVTKQLAKKREYEEDNGNDKLIVGSQLLELFSFVFSFIVMCGSRMIVTASEDYRVIMVTVLSLAAFELSKSGVSMLLKASKVAQLRREVRTGTPAEENWLFPPSPREDGKTSEVLLHEAEVDAALSLVHTCTVMVLEYVSICSYLAAAVVLNDSQFFRGFHNATMTKQKAIHILLMQVVPELFVDLCVLFTASRLGMDLNMYFAYQSRNPKWFMVSKIAIFICVMSVFILSSVHGAQC